MPPAEPKVPFIAETDIKLGIEDRTHTARGDDFDAREWMGATVLARVALQALPGRYIGAS